MRHHPGRRRPQRREEFDRTGAAPDRERHRGADGPARRLRMKIDANQILREQGVSALRGIMDAARPFNDHDVTGEASPMPSKPERPDAIETPGLVWRPRKTHWI